MRPKQSERRGLDVPAGVPRGRELGRTVNYEHAVSVYGRRDLEFFTSQYNTGDELGYAAYRALKAIGGDGKSMFDQALEHGIESVSDAPAELVALFESVDNVPDWVDRSQLRRGSVAYWRHGKLVVMALAYAAIGAGFRSYGGTRSLVMSRRLIERDQVGRRLIETLRWAATSTRPGAMDRYGDGFRLTMQVRWIHAAVRYHLSRSDAWDWDDWGLVVSNVDSIYTMGSSFCEAVVVALEKAGVKITQHEKEDITAMWRYIGHVIGLPEDVNFRNWSDLRRKSGMVRILEHPADDGSRALMTSLTDYMCEEKIDGYQVLPAFIDNRLAPHQKRRLTYGLMRSWAGDDVCDELEIANSRLRYLLPAAKPLIVAYDRICRVLPHDDEIKAMRTLDAFGVATATRDGESDVADADDVVQGFVRNSARARDLFTRRAAFTRRKASRRSKSQTWGIRSTGTAVSGSAPARSSTRPR
ncbi:oxygenase MpaB family protein [Haloechinothrix salitolerans]|uniref:oxygenase MpaB family protein n=1 Tax=Haloechinothrix salitolerans TaxID=926830 RepID=UPI0031E6190D